MVCSEKPPSRKSDCGKSVWNKTVIFSLWLSKPLLSSATNLWSASPSQSILHSGIKFQTFNWTYCTQSCNNLITPSQSSQLSLVQLLIHYFSISEIVCNWIEASTCFICGPYWLTADLCESELSLLLVMAMVLNLHIVLALANREAAYRPNWPP